MVAGIIERQGGQVLICRRDTGDQPQHWEFAGGAARVGETPEAAMRRTAAERAGVHVEIHVGQPPMRTKHGRGVIEYRYYLCGLQTGEARPKDYAEVRWVAKGQLCEYDFEQPTRDVVRWLTSAEHR
jgi:ADP-ribose pyrophosphatase YjhB (NUDIX family)